MNIHKAIQACRCQRGLSQRDLGKAIGNDASQIAQLESGARTPGLKTLKRISDALNIPVLAIIFIALEPVELWKLDIEIVQAMNKIYAEFVEEK